MRALVKIGPGTGNIELVDVPEPQCTPGGVKIEVKFAGICGTDIHIYHDRFKYSPPVILGHEFSGIVTETGNNVKKIKSGDRVTVLGSTMVQCGVCEYCTRGYYVFCPERRGMGHGTNGAFTKYVVVREDMVYKLPESISLETGAMTEPFASAVQAIEEITAFNVGDIVLLTGPGPIGLMCLVLLVAHGCRVAVAGIRDDYLRMELAKKLGAEITIDVSAENLDRAIDRITGGRGVDACVECSGATPAIAGCLRLVRIMGKHIQVGITEGTVITDFNTILYKQLQLYGTF